MAKSSTVIATNSNLLLIASLRKDYLTLHQQLLTETDPKTKAILKKWDKMQKLSMIMPKVKVFDDICVGNINLYYVFNYINKIKK
jgi:hypothetical protein